MAAWVQFFHLPKCLLKLSSILTQMAQYIPWIQATRWFYSLPKTAKHSITLQVISTSLTYVITCFGTSMQTLTRTNSNSNHNLQLSQLATNNTVASSFQYSINFHLGPARKKTARRDSQRPTKSVMTSRCIDYDI